MCKNNLLGLTLTLQSITRQNLFDASFVCFCDNCGKLIVNIAVVKDQAGKEYNIGLDCKKTLIDKPIIDKYTALNTFEGKISAKDYKTAINVSSKFLTICGNPDNEICADNWSIYIRDNKPNKLGGTGNIIFSENIGYLQKIGLTPFLIQLKDNNKVKFNG